MVSRSETIIDVSWDEVQGLCQSLANKISEESHRDFDKILAISRGGLFPAGLLARALNIRMLDTVCIASYDENGHHDPVLLKEFHPDFLEGALIVDDLANTGATLRLLKSRLLNPHFATLFIKPQSKELVDWYAKETLPHCRVRFPWDDMTHGTISPKVMYQGIQDTF
ncbi:MAG TPA: phosphoribosyltransferase family protein [Alphaproteobacteria bacterium]|nr:xanthine phosphoribosyltransferase [Alphaproteobacteria bacterium]HOO50910.1 phosphoribosyltransferase family protein [Alphaproteobacteria bacterium]